MKQRQLNVPGYTKVVHFEEEASGLSAIISVHDATLGPGLGGCRCRAYGSFEDALEDVKRLSKGMSYKNALGGIPFGGGKSVIIANPKTDKTPELMQAYGRAVAAMDGLYIGAQDSGITVEDLREARKSTPNIVGFPNEKGEGGDPSPYTAYGVWQGIKAAVKKQFGSDNLKDKRISILGLGSVGMGLAQHLHEEGAIIIAADINEKALDEAKNRFNAEIIAPEDAIAADADVFAPCALGGSINKTSIGRLKAKIVAGAANNQLLTPDMGEALHQRGILYAPDFVINAGGVISVAREWAGQWDGDELRGTLTHIGDTLSNIFDRSEKEDRPTADIANQLAEEIIAKARNLSAAE